MPSHVAHTNLYMWHVVARRAPNLQLFSDKRTAAFVITQTRVHRPCNMLQHSKRGFVPNPSHNVSSQRQEQTKHVSLAYALVRAFSNHFVCFNILRIAQCPRSEGVRSWARKYRTACRSHNRPHRCTSRPRANNAICGRSRHVKLVIGCMTHRQICALVRRHAHSHRGREMIQMNGRSTS